MPCVQRDREKRTLLPFNGFPGFSFLPDGAGAFTFHDVHDRLVHMVFRLQFTLGGDFHDLKVHILLIAEPGIGGLPAPSLPVLSGKVDRSSRMLPSYRGTPSLSTKRL